MVSKTKLGKLQNSITKTTPLKINMEPENFNFEKETPLPSGPFSGSMLVFGGVPFSPFARLNQIQPSGFFPSWVMFESTPPMNLSDSSFASPRWASLGSQSNH